jgi:nucleoside-diphosphate-sugar epimerase
MKNTALIVGGTGIIGAQLVAHFAGRDDWDVVAAARRPPTAPAGHAAVAVDLLDPQDCAAKLGPLRDVTHVFYCAYQERPNRAEEVAPNLAMLTNAVDVLGGRAGTVRAHHAGGRRTAPSSARTRFGEESDPRHMPPNSTSTRRTSERQAGKPWRWIALRPGIVGGISFGNPMNLTAVIAAYAVISRELGLPLRFPGTPAGYSALHQATDSGLLAKAVEWTATHEACANEVYNVTNGDYFRWENLWPAFAAHFRMPLGPVQTIRLTEFMPDKAALWTKMAAKYGLAVRFSASRRGASATQQCTVTGMRSRTSTSCVAPASGGSTARDVPRLFADTRAPDHPPSAGTGPACERSVFASHFATVRTASSPEVSGRNWPGSRSCTRHCGT